MERVVKFIASALGILATLATLIMMLAIATDVVYRLFYNRSVPGVLEISETALVAAVFLGLAYTGVTNSHIAVDLLTERLPHKALYPVLAAAWMLSSLFLAWMLWATTLRAIASTRQGELRMGLVSWPLYPSRWMLVIGIAVMLMVALINLARTIRGREVLGFDSSEQVTDAPAHPYELVLAEEDTDPSDPELPKEKRP